MTHALEIGEGAAIDPGTITPYRCDHNHLFLVLGPHVFCRCKGRRIVWQKPAEHCPCGKPGYHAHLDGTEGVLRSDAIQVFCNCGGNTKGVANIPRRDLRAAEAAYILNGYAGAVQLLQGPGRTPYPPHRSGANYDHPLPENFPPGR